MVGDATSSNYVRLAETDDVERGVGNEAKPRRSMHDAEVYDNQQEPLLEDERLESVVLTKPDVPTPPQARLRVLLIMRWLVVVASAFGVLWLLLEFSVGQQVVVLHPEDNVSLVLQNCDLDIRSLEAAPSSGDSAHAVGTLTLQYWRFLGDASLQQRKRSDGSSSIKARLDMSVRVPMLRCLVSMRVLEGSKHATMARVSARVAGIDDSRTRVALRAVPARLVSMDVRNARFRAFTLPPELHLQAAHAIVELRPERLDGEAKVRADVQDTSFALETSAATDLQLSESAEKGSVLSAPFVKKQGNSRVQLGLGRDASDSSLHVALNATGQSTSHVLIMTSGDNTKLKTVYGEWQDGSSPQLANSSEVEMKDSAKWIEERSKSTAPWIFRAQVHGGALEPGHWYVVSSQAFLTLPLEVFVIVSAGFLHPFLRQVSIRILGLPASWPPENGDARVTQDHMRHTAEHVDDELEDEDEDKPPVCSQSSQKNTTHCSHGSLRQWEIFRTLEPYLSASQHATIAWVPTEGPAVLYTRHAGSWRAARQNAMRSSLLFYVALSLNLIASLCMATILVYIIRRQLRTITRFQDEAVAITSSQRTTWGSEGDRMWKVLAVQSNIPDHVIILRWRLRTGSERAAYFSIFAEAEAFGSEEPHEVYIEKVSADKLMSMARHTVITELKFSISGDYGFGYDPTGKRLRYQHCYRFQVYAYDADDMGVGQSAWSNGVVVQPPASVFEIPFLVLKTYFPVPTSSLGYFVDHFASFLIRGVVPQHLLVLSEIKVVYHRNFRDFSGKEGPFFVTAYMGEDKATCEAETRTGRSITYDTTRSFTPKRLCTLAEEQLTEEDEELLCKDDERIENGQDSVERAQMLGSQEIRLGASDRECAAVWISMRWESNEEDVAEAKVDFEDFMEAFEEIDRDDADKDQTLFFDLKTDTKADFDEDYLVWIQARVSFTNSVDPQCKALPKEQRLFLKDAPGQIFYEGMERFVSWGEENELLSGIDSFDLYCMYPDHPWIEPKLLIGKVLTKSVGVTFMLGFPEQVKDCYAVCQLLVKARSLDGTTVVDESGSIRSHRFVVCRTWTLNDFELAYASFCKMNDMPMERLSEENLSKYRLSTTKVQLKVVPDLRAPLPFEQHLEDVAISCPGMVKIGNENVYTAEEGDGDPDALAAHGDSRFDVAAGNSEAGGSKSGKSLADRRSMAPSGSAATGAEDGFKAEQITRDVFRATSQDVVVMEHVWPTLGQSLSLKYGTGWVPSVLLMHGFYPVDNIMEFLVGVAELARLDSLYSGMQQVFGAHLADGFLEFIVAPITWFLPFFAEGLLFLLQLFIFMMFPALLVALALVFEFLAGHYGEHFSFESDSFLSDVAFGHQVSGIDMWDWLARLAPSSRMALVVWIGTVLLQLVLIFEANFIRRALPWFLQRFAHDCFNNIAKLLVMGYVWVFLFLCSMCAMWFLMAVVIYPEEMLTSLACLVGMALVLHAMFARYDALRAQVISFLRAEVPEALSIVCDNFLDAYDKSKLSQQKFVERNLDKQEELVWKSLASYYRKRLTGVAPSAHHFKKVFADTVDPSDVQRVFNRAFLKTKHWDKLLEKEALAAAPGGLDPELVNNAADASGLKSTIRVLRDLGMGHDDAYKQSVYDLRMQIVDRETEAGGETVHLYDKDLREKLMRVFVRIQEDFQQLPPDVAEVLKDPKAISHAFVRAHGSKLKIVDPSRVSEGHDVKDTKTLFQLFVQDVQHQKLKRMYFYIAEHLDVELDPQVISSRATPFLEKLIPDEINKHLRLTLDENKVGSSMQILFESLRRWKGSQNEKALQESLVLHPQHKSGGLMEVLRQLGVINKGALLPSYKVAFYNKISRNIRQWKSEETTGNALDPELLEEFVRELVSGYIWWGALREIFARIGFPMLPPGAPHQTDMLTEEHVMREFERKCLKEGLLPVNALLDFIRDLTRGEKVEGTAGRIWKSQMMYLMQQIGVCGFLVAEDSISHKHSDRTEDDTHNLMSSHLSELKQKVWPKWMEELWHKLAPEWCPKFVEDIDRKSNSSAPRPFLPKSALYIFMRSVGFAQELDAASATDLSLKEIDEVYDNWKVSSVEENATSVWVKRSKVHLQLRGIWHECFLKVLDRMDNGVKDERAGIQLFERALDQQRKWKARTGHGSVAQEGLLDFEFFESVWLKEQMENTKECSLQVFKEALQMAEITIPENIMDALWYAADKEKCKHSSLRNIIDLEDRLVMYLSKGLCLESARVLVHDELQSPTLHSRSPDAIRKAFRQVDTKTGMVGFIEPREVGEMILLLTGDGIDLATLHHCFKKLKITIPDDVVKRAFLMMDTNSDNVIDMPEFLGMIDFLIETLLPEQIFKGMGMSPQQVVSTLLVTGLVFSMVALFVFVSLGAFQVQVSNTASGTGSSMIRAGIAVVAALGLRRDNSEEDLDKRFSAVREQLYSMMGVTQSQLEARRRATASLGLGGQSGGTTRVRLDRRSKDDDEEEDKGGEEE